MTSVYTSQLIQALSPVSNVIFPKDIPNFEGISLDTQTLKKGNLFIARKGTHADGHDYVQEAFLKGAVLAITEKPMDGSCVVVPSSQEALFHLALYKRQQTKAHVIGITGSVGKTSTKEIFSHVLSHFGNVVASKDSFNNCVGVPLTLFDLDPHIDFGVIEIGTNHRGEIAELTRWVRPQTVIITAIAPAHVEGLGDQILEEKSDILNDSFSLALVPEIVLKHTSERGLKNIHSIHHLHAYYENGWTTIKANLLDRYVEYKVPLSEHLALNSLFPVAFAIDHCLDLPTVFHALQTIQPCKGRGRKMSLQLSQKNISVFDDSYNANPTSMQAGIYSFIKDTQGKRRIAVLGDMLELGDQSLTYHLDLDLSAIDLVFCCGPFLKEKFETLPPCQQGIWTSTSKELVPFIINALQDDDALFCKGSKGSKITYIVEELRNFSTHPIT